MLLKINNFLKSLTVTVTNELWLKIQTFFRSKILIPNLSTQSASIGFVDNDSDNYIFIHHLLLIFKLYVYSDRNINVLKVNTFIQKFIFVENLERFSIDNNKHKAAFHAKKWSTVIPLLLHQYFFFLCYLSKSSISLYNNTYLCLII